MSVAIELSDEELAEELARRGKATIQIKVGQKKGVVVSGPGLRQRFPITLYAPAWVELLQDANVKAIKDFIEAHKDELSWGKDE